MPNKHGLERRLRGYERVLAKGPEGQGKDQISLDVVKEIRGKKAQESGLEE